MSDCQHPNFFFKEFKFYCRTCGEEVNDKQSLDEEEERPEWDWLKRK